MKALSIGGTGTIGTAVTELARERGREAALLNRGSESVPEGMESIVADIHDKEAVARVAESRTYDVMAQFIAYGAEGMERDTWLFQGRTRQYIFTSSASMYQKPMTNRPIVESTPSINPYWEYSRKKIDVEEVPAAAYRRNGFPVTIMRPSHAYDGKKPPVVIHGDEENWQILKQVLEGRPITMPGGGTSSWTLTHSTDFAGGCVGLMGDLHAIDNAYHITSDESMTRNQIYETLTEALDKFLNALHVASDFLVEHGKEYDFEGQLLGDKACTALFNNTKVRRVVPDSVRRVSMVEGIRSSAHYMMDHPKSQTPDPRFDTWYDRIAEAWEVTNEAPGK